MAQLSLAKPVSSSFSLELFFSDWGSVSSLYTLVVHLFHSLCSFPARILKLWMSSRLPPRRTSSCYATRILWRPRIGTLSRTGTYATSRMRSGPPPSLMQRHVRYRAAVWWVRYTCRRLSSLAPGSRTGSSSYVWRMFARMHALITQQYAVALYVPNVPDFVFTMTGKRSEAPMAMVEVGLASLHARGMPRPVAASAVSHSPPGPWRREVDLKQGWTVLMGAGYDGRHLSFQ
jgi:hypothetical protein